MDLPLTSIHPHSLTASKNSLITLDFAWILWPESKLDIHQQFEWTQLVIHLPICQKEQNFVSQPRKVLHEKDQQAVASGRYASFTPFKNFSLTVWREADSTGCWPALGVKSNPQNVLMRTYFLWYLLVLAYSQVLISWQHIAWSQCVCVCRFVKD